MIYLAIIVTIIMLAISININLSPPNIPNDKDSISDAYNFGYDDGEMDAYNELDDPNSKMTECPYTEQSLIDAWLDGWNDAYFGIHDGTDN
jgi:ribosome modulation factor